MISKSITDKTTTSTPQKVDEYCDSDSIISEQSLSVIDDDTLTIKEKSNITPRWHSFSEQQIRCVVTRWDDDFIYVTEEFNGGELKVCYGEDNKYLSREGAGDWGYLKTIIQKNSQLSLVRIRMIDDVCYPELIIYQPDYLINITTIASCFETYTAAPVVALIKRLTKQRDSSHTHLGNIAGHFLDNVIHNIEEDFSHVFNSYFHDNILSVLTCSDLVSQADFEAFKNKSERQLNIISKVIAKDLPTMLPDLHTDDIILEPTFFSEVLGIQGRFDFLSETDNDVVIIEQKSGKARFVPGENRDRDIPQIKVTHWIQLLLYRALYLYEFNKYADQLRHIMLLYSDYVNGLVPVARSRELFLQAIKMRNLLAYHEMSYAQDGVEMLDSLSADELNTNQLTGRLWTDYVRPELESVLNPIQNASVIEKKYFFRFMRFVAKEHLLSKLGNQTNNDRGFASVWHDTLEEKKSAGNIYDELTIKELKKDDYGRVNSIVFTFPNDHSVGTSNFRRGDIVFTYHYKKGTCPRACSGMVMRGSISELHTTSVEILLRNPQTQTSVFSFNEDMLWAVEHDMYESSSSSLVLGLHNLLRAPQERKDLLLSQRNPIIDDTLYIKGDYGAFNELVLRAKQARELFLVIGPPGTGKTSFGLMSILREELLESDTNILLLSYTNRAVDEICSKLEEGDTPIDYVRIGSEILCEKKYKKNTLSNKFATCLRGKDVRNALLQTRVFCGTVTAVSSHAELFQLKHFDLAIIDESSQILEPHLATLFSASHKNKNAISRFVFIGDHKQLPAVVQQSQDDSAVSDEVLLNIGLTNCRNSLFERLLTQFKTDDGYDARYVYMLRNHARMHEEIAAFPNHAFYGDQLRAVPLPHQTLSNIDNHSDNGIIRLLTSHRLSFVATTKPSHSLSPKTNTTEAEMIAATVVQVYEMTRDSFDASHTIGVIVPYRNQISTIRKAIDHYGIDILHDITIDTVERYQGSQRDYILYGFAVQYSYQLAFLTDNVFREGDTLIDRKLNVAMTRARLGMVLFGNPTILHLAPVFHEMIEFIRQHGAYYDVSSSIYLSTHF